MILPLSLMKQRKQELDTPIGKRWAPPWLWALVREQDALRRAAPKFVAMNTPFQETVWGRR